MKKAVLISQYLLGAIYVVFGFNGFFNFIPMPPMPDVAMAYMGGLMTAPYFFPFLKITEIACGAMLLSGRYVPLALVVLAPITIQIVLFHLFLAPGGLALPVVMLIAQALLAKGYWKHFKDILNQNAKAA